MTQIFFSNTLDLLETFQEWESVEEKKSIDYYFGETTARRSRQTARCERSRKKVCSTDVSVNHSDRLLPDLPQDRRGGKAPASASPGDPRPVQGSPQFRVQGLVVRSGLASGKELKCRR